MRKLGVCTKVSSNVIKIEFQTETRVDLRIHEAVFVDTNGKAIGTTESRALYALFPDKNKVATASYSFPTSGGPYIGIKLRIGVEPTREEIILELPIDVTPSGKVVEF